ncbi:uncharacterized protein LOC135120435 isoform X2 [Zophobas morio]|uniref:uncharacterized protein LOC135120435 isoform X2 n=1 Tax=Zophobas morio TaxID=2755281 RepID=UPI003083833A
MSFLHLSLLPHSFAKFWAGSSVAIAIEARSKLKAKNLKRRVAFEVSRHVFKSQFRLEWMLLAATWLSLQKGAANFIALTIATLAFLINQLVLSPILMERADAIVRGEVIKPTKTHSAFIVKCLALLYV